MLKNPFNKKIDFRAVDLTHTLSSDIPTWDDNSGFELSIDTDYEDCTPPDLFCSQSIKSRAGIGTHIDAPAHVIAGGRTIDKLTIEELVTDCVVIDVSHEANEDYVILPSVIEKFEKEYGKIQAGTFVIFYTGWDKYWEDKNKYHNKHRFPSVDVSTANILLERDITGLGVDMLSADTGEHGFPVHRAILGKDKYLVENITNVKTLPSVGAKVCILPVKIKNATEAPVGLIALLPK